MLAVAKKDDLTYPTTEQWKSGVAEELRRRGRGAQSALAKFIPCSTGQLTEMFGPDGKHSRYVARVHAFFGWPPPMPPIASADAGELQHQYQRMSAAQLKLMRDLAPIVAGKSGAEALRLVEAAVEAFRRPGNENDKGR